MQDFNSFLQSLLSNPSPQGGMMGGGGNQPNRNFYDQAGNDAYYQNPYRMQDSIDAGMLKRKEADAAMAAAMGQQTPQINGNPDGGDGYDGGGGGTPDGSFGLGMGVDGVDAGLGGPGSGVGMSPTQGGMLGGVLGSLLGMPAVGYNIGKTLATSPPTTNTPMAVVNNARANAMPVDPGIQAAINAAIGAGGGTPAGPLGAVTSPVDMSFSPSTPIGPMGGGGGGGFDGGGIGGSIGGGGGLGGFF